MVAAQSLFTPLFPSTKSAKIMCDPSTGLSRGYGFVRFGEEPDMHRALALGRSTAAAGSGLSLRGRTIRISEASGSSGTAGAPNAAEGAGFAGPQNGGPEGNQQGPRRAPSAAPSGADRSDAASPAAGSTHHIPAGYSSGRPNLPPLAVPIATSHHHYFPGAAPSPTLLSPFGMAPAGGHHTAPAGAFYAPLALSPTAGGFAVAPAQVAALAAAATSNPATDPNNTTVFVGGLPACISEETLKVRIFFVVCIRALLTCPSPQSFFQHFGEITYVKIPPNKGCGFVQFVRRPDAEMAIAKMHDFPIHGKSRIRLSWGRSQGDKQVEHVRKLAAALGVPFDAVWRMVQGQDNSTIKQIASAVGSASNANAAAAAAAQRGREEQLAAAVQAQAAAQAVAQAQAQAMAHAQQQNPGQGQPVNGQQQGGRGPDLTSPRSSTSLDPLGGDFFPRSQPALASLDRENAGAAGAGPYSRVSPSHFAPFSNAATPSAPASNLGLQQNQMPLSPPPSASSYNAPAANAGFGQGQSAGGYHSGAQAAYGLNTTASPYERVEFAQGGLLGRHSAERGYHAAPHHPNSAPPEVSSFAGGAGAPGAGGRAGGRGGNARGAWDRPQQPSYDSIHSSMHPVNEADWDTFEGEFGSKLSLGGGQSRSDIQARLTGQQQQSHQQQHRDDREQPDGRGFGRDPFSSNAWGSWLETPGMKA